MKVAHHTVVSIDYTLTDDAGQVLDKSERGEPLSYIHGEGHIIAGLEKALVGKSVGEAFRVRLEAADAYGDYDPALVITADRKQFGAKPKVGMRVQAQGPDGVGVLTVTAIEGDKVHLDGNHPLAGKPLNFAVEVVGVRAATKQELEHGHAHGHHGHDH